MKFWKQNDQFWTKPVKFRIILIFTFSTSFFYIKIGPDRTKERRKRLNPSLILTTCQLCIFVGKIRFQLENYFLEHWEN